METMMYRVLVYIIVIKHRHNVGHDTLVDICFRSGISAGQRQLISGLVTGVTNPHVQLICCSTRVTKGLIYVDLTGSSPLMQIGMTDFMPGRVVIDASQRKRVNATEDGFKGFCGSKTLEQEVWYLCDVLNYAFLASRLQYASLQTKLLRHSGVVASGPTFNDALCAFNTKMETGLLSNTKIPTSFLIFSTKWLLWQSQMKDHTSDWHRVVPISGLGHTMNESPPLTQSGIADFVSGRVVIDATHVKRVKYEV
ncbi:hypothetical protein Tco_0193875 [Tanacetum coccineum]